jgi:S-DNA-T family DNA segregation ATPase FtsK/SpoIIIE
LLEKPVAATGKGDDLQANTKIIEETLGRFSIKVKVVEVEQGPTVTRYELLPAPGVKVNSISALSDDLALALKARSIRLIIPIPENQPWVWKCPTLLKQQ